MPTEHPAAGAAQTFPLTANRGSRIGFLLVWMACLAGALAWILYDSQSLWFLLIAILVLLVEIAHLAVELLAKVCLETEGITIRVLGMTVRRVTTERIRTLAGIRGLRSQNDPDWLAVCDRSLEELTALGKKRMPKWMRTEHPRWPGEFAEKYLFAKTKGIGGGYMLYDRHALFLDWSPERLKLLQQMYPDARWLDCTREGYFEKQIKS